MVVAVIKSSFFWFRVRSVKKWSSCFAVLKKMVAVFRCQKRNCRIPVCTRGPRVSLCPCVPVGVSLCTCLSPRRRTHSKKNTLANRYGQEKESTPWRPCQVAKLWHTTLCGDHVRWPNSCKKTFSDHVRWPRNYTTARRNQPSTSFEPRCGHTQRTTMTIFQMGRPTEKALSANSAGHNTRATPNQCA